MQKKNTLYLQINFNNLTTMKETVKNLINSFVIIGFFFCGCTNSEKEQQQTVSEENNNIKITEIISEPKPKFNVKHGMVMNINNKEFRQLVYDYSLDSKSEFKGQLPCIVQFYADWCLPCRIISPLLVDMADKYKGKINIFKVNVDYEPTLANFYNVRVLPSLLFCKQGNEPYMQLGIVDNETLNSLIEKHLLK